jgi:cell division protein FtsB
MSTPSRNSGSQSQRRPASAPATSTKVGSQPIRKSTPKPPPKQVASMQIVFGSILAISLLLAINFSGRIAAGQRIQAELIVLQATIAHEEMQATALRQEFDFVSSDAFVEEWARSPEGMMIKPGEVLVIPVPGKPQIRPTATPFVPSADNSTERDNQNWTLWWSMFFDGPPPGSDN